MSIVSEITRLTSAKAAIGEAIAGKGVSVPENVRLEGMAPLIAAIETGTGGDSGESGSGGGGGNTSASAGIEAIQWKDVLFIDYDGTVLYSYTTEEVQAMTELPPLPSHDGLICQGWNYDLATLKEHNREVTVGAMYTTDDGKTRIYIRLAEGRTSPILGCCPNGTVTIDWGDGSATETLTGTSVTTLVYSGTHAYPRAGDYMITLTVNGTLGFAGKNYAIGEGTGLLRSSSSDADFLNHAYQLSIRKIEIGDHVVQLYDYAFARCMDLHSITIPNTVTNFRYSIFRYCCNLRGVTIPNSATKVDQYWFDLCYSLEHVSLPNTITNIANYAFEYCYGLSRITIPDSVTQIGSYAFKECYSIRKMTIPRNLGTILGYAFIQNYSLTRVVFLGSVKTIGTYLFNNCKALVYLDLTQCTAIPTLNSTHTFDGASSDYTILVPAALEESWKTATNWSLWADHIVGV